MAYDWHEDPKPFVPQVVMDNGTIKITKAAVEELGFGKPDFVQLGWDDAVQRLAIRASGKENGFKVNGSRTGNVSIKTEKFKIIDLTKWTPANGTILKEKDGIFAVELDKIGSAAKKSSWSQLTESDYARMGIDPNDSTHPTYHKGKGVPKTVKDAREKALSKLDMKS